MRFEDSQTILNLARAFAGESQARNRYTIYAGCARKEGHELIARLFEETAHNELEHAEQFYSLLHELGGSTLENLHIDAGYPYPLGDTLANLGYAAEGEREEYEQVYPNFASVAREEGFLSAAQKLEQIADIERTHEGLFLQMRRLLSSGELYRSESPVIWRCTNCGHIHLSTQPWERCPVCQKDRGWAEKRPDWTQAGPEH